MSVAQRRRPSEIHVPPQCRDLIERGALVAVSHSGGKDSQCMMLLLSRLVPREQLLVVHAPLGEVEWPNTIDHIQSTIPNGVPFVAFNALSSGTPGRRHRQDIAVPAECRKMIDRGALVAVSHSGGKDSQAMTILLSRIVPRDQLLAVHTPLVEVEWPGTIAQIENTIPVGVPLIFAHVASGKSLLERVQERGKFSGIRQRRCTAEHKRGPIERELRRYLKAHPRFGGRLVNCLGIRRDESTARAKRGPWRRNDRSDSSLSGASSPTTRQGTG